MLQVILPYWWWLDLMAGTNDIILLAAITGANTRLYHCTTVAPSTNMV